MVYYGVKSKEGGVAVQRLLLIVNPAAGTKKAAKNLTQIVACFNRAGYDTRVYITAARGDASQAAKLWGGDVDMVVCCGGDGTLNETVSGLIEAGLQTPLGYIPTGSTNDFAGSLGLQSDPIKAAEQIVNGTAHSYDIGRFNDRYFSYVASFGAFTKASYNTPQNVKNALGHIAYVLEGIYELSGIRKEHICIEAGDTLYEDDYLFGAVCNSTSVGGVIKLNPQLVDMSDGQFELLLVRAPRDIQEVHECVVALQTQKYNCSMVTFCNADRLKVYSPAKMTWSLDGERAETDGVVTVENLHGAIRLVH